MSAHVFVILLLAAACAFAEEEASPTPSLEPMPEQAFSAQAAKATPAPAAAPAETPTETSSVGTTALTLGPDSEAEITSLDGQSAERKERWFQRWLDTLSALWPVGEPGVRDNLVLTLNTNVGYDTNVLYSATNKVGSATAGANAVLDYKFGSPRFQLESKLTGGVLYYQDRPGGNRDQNYQLLLAAEHQWRPRVHFSFSTNTAYLAQPQPQLVGGVQQFTGSYFYTDTNLGAQIALRPRWSLTLGFQINGFKYQDEAINEGSGYTQQNYSLGMNYLLTPRTTLLFQYRYNPVQYYASGNGSVGQFLLVGVQQTLTPRFTYGLNGGLEYRELQSTNPNGPKSYAGPFVEGEMTYKAGPDFDIGGNLRYGTEPSGGTTVTVRQTFRAGLSATKAFGYHFDAGLNIYYTSDRYDQSPPFSDYSQDTYTASIDLRYKFARYIALTLHYDYQYVTQEPPPTEYTRSYISLGMQFIF
jgi:hypothetical protein